jgi:hypothetical protein
MANSKKRLGSLRYSIIVAAFVLGTAVGFLAAYLSGLHPSYVPLTSAVLGLLVAFAVPVWQTFFINVPHLSVEITAIQRTVSDAAVVSIDDDPELSPLRTRDSLVPFFIDGPELFARRQRKAGFSLTEIEDLLSRAKQRLRDLPAQIEERKKDLDRVKSITPATLTQYECDQLNVPLDPEIDFDSAAPEKTLGALHTTYAKRLDDLEKRYADLQTNLPATERKIDVLKTQFIANRSYFTVSVSLINSGRSNTAIKVPGLLRVSIGEGNYIDLKLSLKDFQNKSEISANGTRIVVYESSEVSSLPEEDRKLINTYWGQSVSSRLLLEDIHSHIYSSNAIAFAEGLYQKIIYDRLGRAASSDT